MHENDQDYDEDIAWALAVKQWGGIAWAKLSAGEVLDGLLARNDNGLCAARLCHNAGVCAINNTPCSRAV